MSKLNAYVHSRAARTYMQRSTLFVVVGIFLLSAVATIVSTSSRSASAEAGYSWSQIALNGEWSAFAASRNGSHLIGAISGGSIYTSNAAGDVWNAQVAAGIRNWKDAAISNDGNTIIAVTSDQDEYVYLSSDAGQSWSQIPNLPVTTWKAVDSSVDGSRLIAATGTGGIYISTNSGVTWQASGAPDAQWRDVATSANGQTMVATAQGSGTSGTYFSYNGGTSWVRSEESIYFNVVKVAISADGTLVHALNPSSIFTMRNFNDEPYKEWLQSNAGGNNNTIFNTFATSNNGRQIVVAADNFIVTTDDTGINWARQTDTQNEDYIDWSAVAIGQNGTVFAGGPSTDIWKATVPLVVASVPSAPSNLFPFSGGGGHTDNYFIWRSSIDDGGSSITDYKFEYRKDGTSEWIEVAHTASTATKIHVTTFEPGTDYDIRVSAVNSIGSSEAAEYTSFGTNPFYKTTAPLNIGLSAGNHAVNLTWESPSDTGGELLGYEVEYKERTANSWQSASTTVSPNAHSYTVSGLTNDIEYQFRVRAFNSVGQSSWLDYRVSNSATPFEPNTSVSISADGTVFAVIDMDGYVWISKNKGSTWTRIDSLGQSYSRMALGVSSDGTHLITSIGSNDDDGDGEYGPGKLFVSDDTGQTWTASDSTGYGDWSSVVASSDGSRYFAVGTTVDNESGVFSSTNGGISWVKVAESGDEGGYNTWFNVAYADETNILYGVEVDGIGVTSLRKSVDYGATWEMLLESDAVYSYNSVMTNADGTKILLDAYDVQNYQSGFGILSLDGGATWNMDATGFGTAWVASFDENAYYRSISGAVTRLVPGAYATPVAPTPTEPTTNVGGSELENGLVISKRPTFSGVANPFDTILVTVHSDPVTCTTTADVNGFWSCTLPSDLEPGTHTVMVQVTAASDGEVQLFGPYTVTVLGVGQSVTIGAPNTGYKKIIQAQKERLERQAKASSIALQIAMIVSGSVILIGLLVISLKVNRQRQ